MLAGSEGKRSRDAKRAGPRNNNPSMPLVDTLRDGGYSLGSVKVPPKSMYKHLLT